jgi:uncharacterized protein YbbK (DUF523 family)
MSQITAQDTTSYIEEAISKPEIQKKIMNALEGGLEAVRYVWDGKIQQAQEQVDHATRIKAVQICLEYILGRPVERKQVLVAHHHKNQDAEGLVRQSPALRKRLKELVSEEEDEANG